MLIANPRARISAIGISISVATANRHRWAKYRQCQSSYGDSQVAISWNTTPASPSTPSPVSVHPTLCAPERDNRAPRSHAGGVKRASQKRWHAASASGGGPHPQGPQIPCSHRRFNRATFSAAYSASPQALTHDEKTAARLSVPAGSIRGPVGDCDGIGISRGSRFRSLYAFDHRPTGQMTVRFCELAELRGKIEIRIRQVELANPG